MSQRFCVLIGQHWVERMVIFADAANVKDTNFVYRTEGAFGLIFVDVARARVLKVFRRKHEASERHCRAVFEAETEAYRLASVSPNLKDLVPAFHGARSNVTVLDAKGKDVSAAFIPDLAYEMDFIAGSFQKIGAVQPAEADRIKTLFRAEGIAYLTDASVVLVGGKIDKVIDFAVEVGIRSDRY
jgi:hypothetical protein